MRALAPSTAPALDRAAKDSVFSISALVGMGRGKAPAQEAATEVSQRLGDNSLLVENMTGGFAQRCDNLMEDMAYAREAPMFFAPSWWLETYEAGVRNEMWMIWWSNMRVPS